MPLKVLDYGKLKPFGEIIGRQRRLAWPVNAYRVTLPQVSGKGDGLNPFERVILKIIDAGGAREAEALAREACIPCDLVECILLRLRDKAVIDEHNAIIKQKRNKPEYEATEPVFVITIVFRELATGKILPFYHLLDDNHPLRKKENGETPFRTIRYDDAQMERPPTARDVISSLRAMSKRSLAYGNVPPLVPTPQQITIATEPEQYYLDCPIALQKSDGEVRIADPFGNGFSLILESAFNSLLEQDSNLSDWLLNWKQELSSSSREDEARQKESFDTDANCGRYPHLVSNLRLKRDKQHRSIQQIHAALEWALFYSCARRPFDVAVNRLRFTSQSGHPELLKAAAEAVSLSLPQHGFLPIFPGKLADFLSGKAEMGTVLSISLLMAEKDGLHPLRRVAVKYPNFITQILDIKKYRDAQLHGSGRAQKEDVQFPEEAFIGEVIHFLLPDVHLTETATTRLNDDKIADSLLDARASIQSEFGFKLFNCLGTDLQDQLIYVECFWLSCNDGDDALTFACDLYAGLQRAFRRRLSGALPPELKDSEFASVAQKKASQSGLGQLPECLYTVKSIAIRETLQGNDKTLGACVVAFLLLSDASTLRSVADAQPAFISDIADVIVRRGHGNEPLRLSRSEIGKLRKSTYSTIKALLET